MSKTKRVVVVTGGSSGIGKAIVEQFAANGDTVYAAGRRIARLQSIANDRKNIIPLEVNITDTASIGKAIKQIYKKHQTIDVLVNCAGSSGHVEQQISLDAVLAEWNQVIMTNLTGTFLMTYACLPLLKRPGGRIINITSLAALAGSSRPGGEAYSAAKAGVHGMMRSLVKQLSPHGITVNCVSPGVIENTEFFSGASLPDQQKIMMLPQIPAGRVGTPQDVAPAVFYLASEEAGFITGDILHVNGGQVFSR